MRTSPPTLDLPANHVAAVIVRWRVVLYLLLMLAALAIASAERGHTGLRPAPPSVESDD